jgi:hypothetical protein
VTERDSDESHEERKGKRKPKPQRKRQRAGERNLTGQKERQRERDKKTDLLHNRHPEAKVGTEEDQRGGDTEPHHDKSKDHAQGNGGRRLHVPKDLLA